jgi:hypothetical protein
MRRGGSHLIRHPAKLRVLTVWSVVVELYVNDWLPEAWSTQTTAVAVDSDMTVRSFGSTSTVHRPS